MLVKEKSNILGIAGSIRSKTNLINELKSFILKTTSFFELEKMIEQSNIKFSNSDIALACSLLAAQINGAIVDMISLRGIFQSKGQSNDIEDLDHLEMDPDKVRCLLETLRNADGVIFSSPVYFGDRSSVANKFFHLTNRDQLLENKVFGTIAVGAKRNGGQETTCIYSLIDALSQYAMVVGNGPVTSQYGGTVVAGDLLSALSDNWGLERCMELGKQVAHTCSIVKKGTTPDHLNERLNIKVLMMMDTKDKHYQVMTRQYFLPAISKHDVDIIDLTRYSIKRCIACDMCPKLGKSKDSIQYNCIIQDNDDCVVKVYKRIVDADLIVIVGVNSSKEITHRYQAFTERTRCIRRDNYQFSNIPLAGLLINDPSASMNLLHNMKVITSYIRHNMIVVNPMQLILINDKPVYHTDYEPILKQAQIIKKGRRKIGGCSVNYDAEGYLNKTLDGISSLRK